MFVKINYLLCENYYRKIEELEVPEKVSLINLNKIICIRPVIDTKYYKLVMEDKIMYFISKDEYERISELSSPNELNIDELLHRDQVVIQNLSNRCGLPKQDQSYSGRLAEDNLVASQLFGSCDNCGGVLVAGVCNTCRPDPGIRKANKK